MALTSYISGLISSSLYLGYRKYFMYHVSVKYVVALFSSQFFGSFIGGALRYVLSFAMTSNVAGEIVLAEVFKCVILMLFHLHAYNPGIHASWSYYHSQIHKSMMWYMVLETNRGHFSTRIIFCM